MTFPALRAQLRRGLDEHAFPGAVCQVGRRAGALETIACGRLSYDESSSACTAATVFDLASLTKVIATTSLVMHGVRHGRLAVDTRVTDILPEWTIAGADRITVGHLLDHSAGLPAHVRLWERAADAAQMRQHILLVERDAPVGQQSVYSDVGFLILGLLLERLAGPLDVQWRALWPEEFAWLGYLPPAELRPAIAPTEFDSWRGRLLCGEVHDENAARLGGVAAHAGLFGTAEAVGMFAREVMRSHREATWLATPAVIRAFTTARAVPGSSRALGWDTMRPTSSCGTRMSPGAFGHTGFTGTSLWIDLEQDYYVVLLTNRVHPTRTNDRFVPMRSVIHDAIADDLAAKSA